MRIHKILPAALALAMGFATIASAQPRGRDDDRRGPPGHDQRWERGGPPRGHAYGHDRDRDRGPGAGPDHRFHRGDRLPAEYRSRQYVVDDWRGHRLSAPPRGYHWVQMGGDYVLAAIATGVIASLILNN